MASRRTTSIVSLLFAGLSGVNWNASRNQKRVFRRKDEFFLSGCLSIVALWVIEIWRKWSQGAVLLQANLGPVAKQNKTRCLEPLSTGLEGGWFACEQASKSFATLLQIATVLQGELLQIATIPLATLVGSHLLCPVVPPF